MRIYVSPTGALPGLVFAKSEQTIQVGNYSYYLNAGDGIIVYEPNEDFSICKVLTVIEVVGSDPGHGRTTMRVQPTEAIIEPSRVARHRWRTNQYLCPDVAKAKKYGFLTIFADAFNDQTWLDRKLEDNVNNVFRPDLSLPTLLPVEGYVYLFKSSTSYKIGKAVTPEDRKKQVERDVSESLVEVHRISSNDYTRAELELHKRYAHARVRGEWFNLSSEEISEICLITEMNYPGR